MAKDPQNLTQNSPKKPLKREFSAGGVVFKKEKGNTLFLIIQPKGTDRWQFPKGQINPKESSKDAALREVYEEGGVETKIVEKIGSYNIFFYLEGERIFKTVINYLLEYVGGDPDNHDWEVGKSLFLKFDGAFGKLTFKNDKEILTKAKVLIEQGIQEKLV